MSSRTQAILPESLKDVLDMRSSAPKCRTDVETALAKYGLIRTGMAARAPVPPPPTVAAPTRFANLGSPTVPDGWRSKGQGQQGHQGHQGQGQGPEEVASDRWVTATSSKKRGGYSGYGGHSSSHGGHGSSGHGGSHGMSNFRRSETAYAKPEREPVTGPSPGAWRSSRFQPLEETIQNESMEDRIMGKVRAKVNKLGHSTYDSTKAFMKQILDSGETDFLEEFMRFVFGKAATEPAFCGLYARFLHELADEFPHLRETMVRKFREYTRVFDEASQAPDVGTSDYLAFVEAQEQKKFRRGYSQFVAELAKLGEVSMEDFRLLVTRVVETIRVCYVKEENRVMCEEIVDCFMVMVRAAKLDWMREYVETLRSVATAPKETAPGLTNKGRFAIMDILDLVTKRR
jgi:hypothetical protein